MTRRTPRRKSSNRRDDLLGFVGGMVCVGISQVDVEWGLFWAITGIVLIAWSTLSILRRNGGR
jgi:hypothetical protein